MPEPTYQPADFLYADDICGFLAKNLEINFQINGPTMVHPEAVAHFEKRKALIIVKAMLIDEAERVFKR